MQKILLIATGGTIASASGELGLRPSLDVSTLEEYIELVNPDCQIQSLNLLNIDSTNMQPEHWVKIAEAIAANYSMYDGFVITHGTDTMAFTAAALSYFLGNLTKPVVLTGSQVPFQNQKTDAKKNLLDATRMALEPVGGVFVVFNGKVIAGTRAMKIRTKSYDAFESVNFPYIAHITENKIDYKIKLTKTNSNNLQLNTALCTDVLLLKLYPGMKPDFFDILQNMFKGVVIESFGNGGIPSLERDLLPKIEHLVDIGVAVVVTTQCLQEGEDLSLYEVGRKVAANKQIIISKDMNTEAIIPKLMWALGQTDDLAYVKKLVETPIAFDTSI